MDDNKAQAEILRLNKIINALMDRAESNASVQGSDFNLFHTAVALEDQVRRRTQELEKARLENEKITRALRESEQKFRLLVENSHDIIYTLNKEGYVTFVSPAWSALLGYSPEQAVGRFAETFIHPDDIKNVKTFMKHVMENEERREGVEYRVHRSDGTWRWHTSSCLPLHDDDGNVVGIEGIARDVTERRLAEEALKESNRLLEAATAQANALAEEAAIANASKSAFLARMSHELRTPLNAILGFSEVIKDKVLGEKFDRYFEYAQDIYTSGNHLLALINDVLDLSKIEAGQMGLKKAPVDVFELVHEVSRMMEVNFRQRNQGFNVEVQDNLPQVIADRRAIKQVLLNLLSNANKYTPENGHVCLRAFCDEATKTVHIHVQDDGLGIAKEKHERVFKPFQQSGDLTVREKTGTGLGLAISRRLVEMHGGTLTLDSDVGKGATLMMALPLDAPADGG